MQPLALNRPPRQAGSRTGFESMTLPTSSSSVLQDALRRQRVVMVLGLLGLAALAWAYVMRLAMPVDQAGMSMPMGPAGGSMGELGWLAMMWAVMMVAMMVPSATPAILLYAEVSRRRRAQAVPAVSAAWFTLGYLIDWTAFAIVAASAQWVLHRAALLSPMMTSASPLLGGALLIAAGVYQWLPIKGTCLTHCRSPLGFFAAEWREGAAGALTMGLRHGIHCVGCCWLLMALLFVAGVMNLLWIAAIAGFVLVEKLVPGGRMVGRVAGTVLVGWGLLTLAGRV
jgi:predicted metal-binding membrane protein